MSNQVIIFTPKYPITTLLQGVVQLNLLSKKMVHSVINIKILNTNDELTSFDSNEYYSALVQTQPELMDAVNWARSNAGALPEGFGQQV